jgi:glucose-1-phosphate thymidylyltransferase
MKAFVLAAGYATRMYPLTRDRPKPLLEVGDAPILTHLVRSIEPLPGISEIVVIGNRRFAPAFARWHKTMNCALPIRLLDDGSTSDDDKLGAIGDLAFALRAVPVGDEDWMVVAGDNLVRFDLRTVQAHFLERRAPTLTVREVAVSTGESGASRYNEVTLSREARVVRFREKPREQRTGLAAIALYFFPADVAALLTRYLAEGGNPDAPGHFIAWLVDRVPVTATRFTGEWLDIGSLETLKEARLRFASAARATGESPSGTSGAGPPRRP